MGIRPTKAELQADIRALIEGADRQAAVIEDLHKQLRMAQAEATHDTGSVDEGRIAILELAKIELAEIDALCRDMRVRRKIVDQSPGDRKAFIGYLFGLVDGSKRV